MDSSVDHFYLVQLKNVGSLLPVHNPEDTLFILIEDLKTKKNPQKILTFKKLEFNFRIIFLTNWLKTVNQLSKYVVINSLLID